MPPATACKIIWLNFAISFMCVFNTKDGNASFEYDMLFTGGDNVCPKNCSGSGSCNESSCECQTGFAGDFCETSLPELTTANPLEVFADPGVYNFFKVKKESVQDSSSISFKISSSTVNCYVSRDTATTLPTSFNSIKLFPLVSNGQGVVAFKPEDEIPGFADDNYEALVLCNSII